MCLLLPRFMRLFLGACAGLLRGEPQRTLLSPPPSPARHLTQRLVVLLLQQVPLTLQLLATALVLGQLVAQLFGGTVQGGYLLFALGKQIACRGELVLVLGQLVSQLLGGGVRGGVLLVTFGELGACFGELVLVLGQLVSQLLGGSVRGGVLLVTFGELGACFGELVLVLGQLVSQLLGGGV